MHKSTCAARLVVADKSTERAQHHVSALCGLLQSNFPRGTNERLPLLHQETERTRDVAPRPEVNTQLQLEKLYCESGRTSTDTIHAAFCVSKLETPAASFFLP